MQGYIKFDSASTLVSRKILKQRGEIYIPLHEIFEVIKSNESVQSFLMARHFLYNEYKSIAGEEEVENY